MKWFGEETGPYTSHIMDQKRRMRRCKEHSDRREPFSLRTGGVNQCKIYREVRCGLRF